MRPTYEALETELQETKAKLQQAQVDLHQTRAQLEEAMRKIAKLEEQLNCNSKNSSKPPSNDQKGNTGGRQSGEKKGQRSGKARPLFPPTRIDKHIPCTRENCPHCGSKDIRLSREGAEVLQQAEVPEVRAIVTEYQLQKYTCNACGKRSTGELPPGVPDSVFGPKLMGVLATLTGVRHLAKREAVAVIKEIYGIDVAEGSVTNIEERVADALDPIYHRIHEFVLGGKFCKHFDETSWRDDGKHYVVWVASCKHAAFYRIDPSRSEEAFRRLMGPGIDLKDLPAVTDRYSAYNPLGNRRQFCLAHLIRNFEKYAEREGPDGKIGRALKEHLSKICHIHRDYREGKITEWQRNCLLGRHKIKVQLDLIRGIAFGTAGLPNFCLRLWKTRARMWTFMKEPGMEPTNNMAERDLRNLVVWRKNSYGTRGARGRRFVERITTVAQTVKKQGGAILHTIQQTIMNHYAGIAPPSILDPSLA